MWTHAEAEVQAYQEERRRAAERHRRAAQARAARAAASAPAARSGRLRQVLGFGLVRAGLRMLDAGRA